MSTVKGTDRKIYPHIVGKERLNTEHLRQRKRLIFVLRWLPIAVVYAMQFGVLYFVSSKF